MHRSRCSPLSPSHSKDEQWRLSNQAHLPLNSAAAVDSDLTADATKTPCSHDSVSNTSGTPADKKNSSHRLDNEACNTQIHTPDTSSLFRPVTRTAYHQFNCLQIFLEPKVWNNKFNFFQQTMLLTATLWQVRKIISSMMAGEAHTNFARQNKSHNSPPSIPTFCFLRLFPSRLLVPQIIQVFQRKFPTIDSAATRDTRPGAAYLADDDRRRPVHESGLRPGPPTLDEWSDTVQRGTWNASWDEPLCRAFPSSTSRRATSLSPCSKIHSFLHRLNDNNSNNNQDDVHSAIIYARVHSGHLNDCGPAPPNSLLRYYS